MASRSNSRWVSLCLAGSPLSPNASDISYARERIVPPQSSEDPLLECHCDMRKRFGGEVALGRRGFTLHRGEVHGLVGSNGERAKAR